MVTRHHLFYLILFPIFLSAGEFIASVSRKDVAVGESTVLTLTLTNVKAKSAPSLSRLKKVITIDSHQQSSNTVITNGKMTVNTSWQFTLIPEKEGEVIIPPIRIETSEGPLATQPIRLNVSKHSLNPGVSKGRGITLTSKVSKANPYQYEPFVYTVKLVSKHDLANLNMAPMTLEDAIVERLEEEQVEHRMIEGERVAVIEINYLITPLKPGPLDIPATIIRGAFPVKRRLRLGSFFDDDPFQIMRHFDRLEPFSLSTDPITMQVQAPVADVSPWLPAEKLKIEEFWDPSGALKVGEPFTRRILITAEGVKASQLPNMQQLQANEKDFTLYADKPEIKDSRKNGRLLSTRQEQYTLIPKRAGTLWLPEIAIEWWDTKSHREKKAVIAARAVEVLPASRAPGKNELAGEDAASQRSEIVRIEKQDNTLLLAIIASMSLLLLLLFFWGYTLNRKISRLTQSTEKKDLQQQNHAAFSQLSDIHTPQQLHEYLNAYAASQWGVAPNATLSAIFQAIRFRSEPALDQEIFLIEKELEAGLYRNQDINLAHLINRCQKILKQIRKNPSRLIEQRESLPALNPR